MKKLNLDLAALRVESFEPSSDAEQERGTVKGHDYTQMDCFTNP